MSSDNDDELFEAVDELIHNDGKRISMGKAAREFAVERFSISSVVENYISLLSAVENSDVLSNEV